MYVGSVIVLYRFSISSKANPRLFDITSAATPFAFKLLVFLIRSFFSPSARPCFSPSILASSSLVFRKIFFDWEKNPPKFGNMGKSCYLCPKHLKYMEQGADIRWIQRYANFHKACGRLLEVTEADRFIDDFLSSWMKH